MRLPHLSGLYASAMAPVYASAMSPVYASAIVSVYASPMAPVYASAMAPVYAAAMSPVYAAAIVSVYASATAPVYASAMAQDCKWSRCPIRVMNTGLQSSKVMGVGYGVKNEGLEKEKHVRMASRMLGAKLIELYFR